MSKTIQNEREIETKWSQHKTVKLHGRFLKGPISFRHLNVAAQLPGQGLSVYLAIHHQTALTRREWVTLPTSLLNPLGVSRDAKARALQQLETAGLVRVARAKGKSARVSLASNATVGSSSGPTGEDGVIWQNRDWVVRAAGMACRHQLYQITVDQLTEIRKADGNDAVAMWPLQLAEKSWADIEMFIEAFEQALRILQPANWEKLDLASSFSLARGIAGSRRAIG